MSKTTDRHTVERLYLCPNCDEWIEEDAWDAHAPTCREATPAYTWTEDEVLEWMGSMERKHGSRWADDELELEKMADSLAEQYFSDRPHTVPGRPTVLRVPMVAPSRSGSMASPSPSPSRSMAFYEAQLVLPVFMSHSEARVLIRRQLRELRHDDQP